MSDKCDSQPLGRSVAKVATFMFEKQSCTVDRRNGEPVFAVGARYLFHFSLLTFVCWQGAEGKLARRTTRSQSQPLK